MKSPKIHRVLVYTDRELFQGGGLTVGIHVTDAAIGRAAKIKQNNGQKTLYFSVGSRARKKLNRETFYENTRQLATLSFNHPLDVLTAEVTHFFIKNTHTYEYCSSMEEQ